MELDSRTDPVIIDLLRWLKENLPPDTDEEAIFKKVRRIQKVFDTLIGLSFEEFYNNVTAPKTTLEESVDEKLDELKNYLIWNDEKQIKTTKLNASRSKLDLKREQYQLITSIQLNGCMDLISRFNHLMSKK